MNCFTQEQLNRISHIIKEIEKLSDIEKLFLYLQLPCGSIETLERKSSKLNGKSGPESLARKPDQETTQTYTWILSHLEEDSNVSLPKQEVYDEYRAFCQANKFEPLCVADFGKAMKHAFPCIKPRRLGQRGNSRYCYSGLRKKYRIQVPTLPDLIEPTFCMENDCSQACDQIFKDCRDNPNECVLNNCGVINLKVESHNSANYNCAGSSSGPSNELTPYNANDQQQHPQQEHLNLSQGNTDNDAMMLKNKQLRANNDMPPFRTSSMNNATTTPTNNYSHPMQHQPQNHPPPSHHRLPSSQDQPPQSLVTSPSNQLTRYNYAINFVPQRTGTPDDDDYRHNYLGSTPMDCHLAIAGFPMYHHQSLHQQQPPYAEQAPTTSGSSSNGSNIFIYPQQANGAARHSLTPPSAQDLRGRNEGADQSSAVNTPTASQATSKSPGTNHMTASQPFSSDNINSMHPIAPPIASSSASSIANAPHPLSNIYNPSIDFCASPFQSPASTPYPVMGNYLSQDGPDYCLSDCARYVDQ